jgi:hypothetical protein
MGPSGRGRGGGGWKMTPGLDLGRKRRSGIGAFFGVGTALPKGARLIKPSGTPPDPLATVEQRNGWSASLDGLFRCSAVSSEWHALPLLQLRNHAIAGPSRRAVARLHGCTVSGGVEGHTARSNSGRNSAKSSSTVIRSRQSPLGRSPPSRFSRSTKPAYRTMAIPQHH